MANYFDQFDSTPAAPKAGGNYFDQFDAAPQSENAESVEPYEAPMSWFKVDPFDQKTRGADMANMVDATSSAPMGKNQQTVGETIPQIAMNEVYAAGDVAGKAISMAGSALKPFLKVPDYYPQNLQDGANKLQGVATKAGEAIAPYAQQYMQNQEAYDAANPRAGRNFQAVRGLANVLPLGAAPVRKVAGEGLDAAGNAMKNVAKAPFEEAAFVPNSQQMKTYSGALFDDATAKGALINPEILNRIGGKIEQSLPGRGSLDPATSVFVGMKDKVSALMKEGKPLTLNEFEEMDKSLTGLITNEYKTKGATPEATKLMELQTDIRDAVYNPDSGMVQGGREGLDAYKSAVGEWSLAKRKEDIENILQRAEFTDNPSTSIRRQFATLYMDKKRTRGYSKEQMAFIKKASESNKFADFLRTTAGSRLIGSTIGAIAGGAATGGLGVIPGALGGAATGMAARGAATSLKKKEVMKLENSIIKKSGAIAIPREIYDLPPAEAKEAIRKLMEAKRNTPE